MTACDGEVVARGLEDTIVDVEAAAREGDGLADGVEDGFVHSGADAWI